MIFGDVSENVPGQMVENLFASFRVLADFPLIPF
jgi:hypothetical protein